MFYVYVQYSGKWHQCNGPFGSQDLARWWLLNWLRGGYLPVTPAKNAHGEALERFVPSAHCGDVIITDKVLTA